MKVIKTLESWGIDLRKLIKNINGSRPLEAQSITRGGVLSTLMGIVPGIKDALAKVDLTPEDAEEMLEDAGITVGDIMEVVTYFLLSPSTARETDSVLSVYPFNEDVEAPVQLLRLYEQTLANWFLLAGYDTDYNSWGW
jgi:hypothetical protein